MTETRLDQTRLLHRIVLEKNAVHRSSIRWDYFRVDEVSMDLYGTLEGFRMEEIIVMES